MSEQLIYVVGPSGVGKDSLLNRLRAQVEVCVPRPQLHFARRTITRAAGDVTEDHEVVCTADFLKLVQAGAFLLHWEAHGLHYGVRRSEIGGGRGWVMVNGSRAYLAQARVHCPGLTVLHVSAPPEVVRQRLLSRQRESLAEVQARVLRSQSAALDVATDDLHIANTGSLDESVATLCRILQDHTGLPLSSIGHKN
jgi:ribose 1,5-bisphosphokinase